MECWSIGLVGCPHYIAPFIHFKLITYGGVHFLLSLFIGKLGRFDKTHQQSGENGESRHKRKGGQITSGPVKNPALENWREKLDGCSYREGTAHNGTKCLPSEVTSKNQQKYRCAGPMTETVQNDEEIYV